MTDEAATKELTVIGGVQADISIKDLLIDAPLYKIFNISGEFAVKIVSLSYNFDAFCVYCNKESTFRELTSQKGLFTEGYALQPKFFSRAPTCTRDPSHVYIFYLYMMSEGRISKVGQFPSLEDITGPELRKYKNQLRGGYFQELTRANGLISHGIGIGSFVYLRRIFEKLIEDHRAEFEKNGNIVEDFDKLRVDEKIEALKTVLPPALVKNRATYSILSSGIHALSEEECRIYYPVVKAAIIQILEQDFEARERQRVEQELEAAIAEIQGKIKKKPEA